MSMRRSPRPILPARGLVEPEACFGAPAMAQTGPCRSLLTYLGVQTRQISGAFPVTRQGPPVIIHRRQPGHPVAPTALAAAQCAGYRVFFGQASNQGGGGMRFIAGRFESQQCKAIAVKCDVPAARPIFSRLFQGPADGVGTLARWSTMPGIVGPPPPSLRVETCRPRAHPSALNGGQRHRPASLCAPRTRGKRMSTVTSARGVRVSVQSVVRLRPRSALQHLCRLWRASTGRDRIPSPHRPRP